MISQLGLAKMILYLLTERKSFHLEGIACTRNISIVN